MKSILPILLLATLTAGAQEHPRTWHFACDYYVLDVRGDLLGHDRVSANYTRGLDGGKIRWTGVTVAHGTDWGESFLQTIPSEFMEGFSYPLDSVKNMLQPDFFKGFPPEAMNQRNLVWDTHMLEGFAKAYPDKLELNKVYHAASGDAALAGAGTFQNRDVQLTLVGHTKRNGEDCVLVNYSALFNKLAVATPGMNLTGRSNYWGQIWISTSARQIEYATLFEDVLGELKLSGQQPQVINVVRSGVFEPTPGK